MTLLIGILCKDGVVMASDSAATFGANGVMTIGQQATRKIYEVNNHILYCGTGAIGIAQLIAGLTKDMWDKKEIQGTPVQVMNLIGVNIGKQVRPYLETAQLQRALTGEAATSLCKSLIALPVAKKPCLFQFDFGGAPEQATPQLPFVALGSGQMIADPFLAFLKRVVWRDQEPTVADGRLAAVWTIDHVCRTNAGGVGGDIQLATLMQKKSDDLPYVQSVLPDGIQEHQQQIEAAINALVAELTKAPTATAPPAPPAAPNHQ